MTRDELVERFEQYLGAEPPSAGRVVDVLQAILGVELLDGPIDFAGIGRLHPYGGKGSGGPERAKGAATKSPVVVRVPRVPIVFRYPGTRDPGPDAAIPVVVTGVQRRATFRPGATSRFTTAHKVNRPQR